MSINKRIKKIREECFSDSNKEFALGVNKSPSTVNNWIREGFSVGKTVFKALEVALPDINIAWVQTGQGEMFKSDQTFKENVTPVAEGEYMMVEYVDLRASAGKLGGADIEQIPETHRRLVPREFNNGKFLVIRVDGDSMDDGTKRSLSDGDEVLVKDKTMMKLDELPIKKSLFIVTSREGNVLKQITEVNTDEGYITCHSFNPSYPDFKIHFEDIYQVFIVRKIVQKQVSLV